MKIVILPESLKKGFKYILEPIVKFLTLLRLSPNHFTTVSLLISCFSSYLFASGSLRFGSIMLLIGGIFDMVDGAVARATNRVTKFGALYDSTLDRYSEIFVFFGIGYYFIKEHSSTSTIGIIVSMAVFLGLAGSIMVSYVRARAEGLDLECKVGLMQRPERLVVISLGGLITEFTLIISIILVAVLANFTAFQRVYHVWVVENEEKWKTLPPDSPHE